MQKIKSMFLIGLLMINVNLFCDLEKSMNQARSDLYSTTIAAIYSAITIGICSYVFDIILSQFEMAKNMEHRGSVATTACVALYAAFLISAEYHKNSLSEHDNDTQKRGHEIVDGNVSGSVQDNLMGTDLEKNHEQIKDQDDLE